MPISPPTPMCLEGIVQRLHFRRNALCAFGAHQSGHRKRKFCHNLSICHKRKSAFVFPHSVAGQHHVGIVVPCHNQVTGNHVRCSMQRLRISG